MIERLRKAARALFCTVLLLCVPVSRALATELGGGAYPNGAEDFMAGAVPPPGTYFLNYLTWYSADRFNDDADRVESFHLDAVADVVRLLHVTDKKVLGADWGMHIFIPFADVDAEVPSFGIDESRSGLGDIIIDPIILGWHFSKNLHAVAALDIYVPTGKYGQEHLANPGRNYWTFEPVAGVTYVTDGGTDFSAKLMYDFNIENPDTDYTSGNELHMDYTVGHKFGAFSAGAGGYWYQQVTADEAGGDSTAFPMEKGRALAIGPQVKYEYKNMAFTLKYLIEVETRNRPEGNNLWFKFLYAF